MRYFTLNHVGNVNNEDYCFVPTPPRGGEMTAYDLRLGQRIADEYPNGVGEMTLQLGADHPGLELTSYIGNTDSMLVVDRKTAAIIQSHNVGEIELIPFKLLNHKGRVHSKDYVFMNPIGCVDCLNHERSVITRDEDDGSFVRVERVVLAAAKLTDVPDLFRIKEALDCYVFSEKLVNDLRNKGCTNCDFEELAQA
jgi:hypothetical protein